MDIKELRIGNIIQSISKAFGENHLGQWSITEEDMVYIIESENKSHYQPVPITEEWLLKFGFEYRNENKGIGAILDFKNCPENTTVEEWKFHKSVAFVHDKNDEKDIFLTFLSNPTAYKIKYLHQVQNLYFALTQTELTIK